MADYGALAARPGAAGWKEAEQVAEKTAGGALAEDSSHFLYYFYHPVARLVVAFMVCFCNFLIYGEDPVSHSAAEAEVPVLGPVITWVVPEEWRGETHHSVDRPTPIKMFYRWGSLVVLIALGLIFGRIVVHHILLRGCLKLQLCGWKRTDEDDDRRCCHNPYEEGWWTEKEGVNEDREAHEWWTKRKYVDNMLPNGAVGQTEVEQRCPSLCWPRKHQSYNKGTWMSMGLTTAVFITIASTLWNVFAPAMNEPPITDGLYIDYLLFGQIACVGAWLGDCLTFLQIFDSGLQEIGKHWKTLQEQTPLSKDQVKGVITRRPRARPGMVGGQDDTATVATAIQTSSRRFKLGYLRWARDCGLCWGSECCGAGCQVRVLVFYFAACGGTALVLSVVCGEFFSWDDLQERVGLHGSNEFTRCFLAAVICALDIIVVVQDWEFPTFESRMEISMPGTTSTNVNASGGGHGKARPLFNVFITGKWLNYSLFALVCFLDISMLKGCMQYIPEDYGQYVNPANSEICTTHDRSFAMSIVKAWRANKTTTDGVYEQRLAGGHLGPGGSDFCLPDRHHKGIAWYVVWSAAIPAFAAHVLFYVMLFHYNRVDRKRDAAQTGEGKAGDGKGEA
eukprot:TRINITY_DN27372_c0_g1_i1.p1 TRINITY_DN27372_c0_g1~~TRINITY_DN27372_c0_g1_i1.p1  ORF type:complete len:650 (+),score=187.26 TRINITY_DN27372_c0_g1_i1:92-1951(+)